MKKKVDISKKDKREKLFLDIIGILMRYNDEEKKVVAERAEVSWVTLYNWCAGKTQNPHINTLGRVARALGFEIEIRRTANIPVKLKVVK